MKAVFATLIALVGSALFSLGGETEDRAELIRLEEKMAALLAKNDIAALEPMLAPDWKVVLSDGSIMSRDQVVSSVRSGKLEFSTDTVEQLEIRLYADAAVIVGVSSSRGTWDGEPFSGRDRFTDLFIRKEGKWLCVSSHTSNFAEGQ